MSDKTVHDGSVDTENTRTISTNEENIMLINENSRVFYAGFCDLGQAKAAGKTMDWRPFPATAQGLKEALDAGYTARTMFDYSALIPENEEDAHNIIRYGGLLIDIDCKKKVSKSGDKNLFGEGDIPKALLCARTFVNILKNEFELDCTNLQIYASGNKGFHIHIPPELIGAQNGDPNLHDIYRKMVVELVKLQLKKNISSRE